MLFHTELYLVFFAAVFTCYWSVPSQSIRVWLLVIASFVFYATWNHWLAGLICLTSVMDYLVARGMAATTSALRRKMLLFGSLAVNLGLLVYFKYANFFLRSLEDALGSLGATASLPVLSVILPIGISFYTFEAISYTVDVYRGRVAAEKNLSHFMLFITFFPHLVAGPIVRARHFLPQIARAKHWDWKRAELGVQYFLMGLFKKLVVADRMAQFADPVFAHPGLYDSASVWMAVVAYTLQIYCDFSGYTDMAIGSAHLLGYRLPRNFNMPYLARNVSEFWRRWHMSLSKWLRDYVFIPLGGSRGTNYQTRRNLMVTMMIGGLWHGANWTFLLWGTLHGSLLVLHRSFDRHCSPTGPTARFLETATGATLSRALTLLTVMVCWVFFRAPDLHSALIMLQRMASPYSGRHINLGSIGLLLTVAAVATGHVLTYLGFWRRMAASLPSPVMGLGYALALTLSLLLAPEASKAFIYFQF